MIDVKDRIVQYPRRFKLTLVEGTTDVYELTPMPGTIQEEGTPINAELFDNINTDIENINTNLDKLADTIPTPTPANNGQVLGVVNGEYAFIDGGGVSTEANAAGGTTYTIKTLGGGQ